MSSPKGIKAVKRNSNISRHKGKPFRQTKVIMDREQCGFSKPRKLQR